MSSVWISIVIPCRNEEKYIKICLQSILNQDFNENIEVIVVDGLSDDKTPNLVEELAAKNSCITLLNNEKQTTPHALNIGLKAATGSIKMILGAHAELATNYLQELKMEFEKNPTAHCVGGIIENAYENSLSQSIGKAMSSPFGVGNAHFRTGSKSGFVDTVAFGAYKAEVFEKIGYFDESLVRNQDDEFSYRMQKHGLSLYLSNKLSCKYFVRASFHKLRKQYFQYGYWKVYVNVKHRIITTTRQLVPLGFVLFLFSYPLAVLIPFYNYLFVALLITYFLGAILATAQKHPKGKEWIEIPCSFFILHLSYGLGYLRGIIDFLLLSKKPSETQKTLSR